MTTAADQLATGVFQSLLASTELTTHLGGNKVFDHVPERVGFPYIVLGRVSSSDWSTATEEGQAVTFSVHIWSKSTGRAEVFALQEQVKTALQFLPNDLGD